MKKIWFQKFGWFYLPVAIPGILATVLVLAFCVQVFLFIDSRSHSISDTLYGVFPYVAPALLLLDWLASRTSAKEY
jgi:hypothetical protein